MTASAAMSNDWTAVIGVSGDHIMWADRDLAQRFLKAGKVVLIRRRGRKSILQALPEAEIRKPGEVRSLGRGTALDHTRYSHRRETDQNPPRVWSHTRLAPSVHEMFLAVVCESYHGGFPANPDADARIRNGRGRINAAGPTRRPFGSVDVRSTQ